MILEYTQLLSSAYYDLTTGKFLIDPQHLAITFPRKDRDGNPQFYKLTHKGHPCIKWVNDSLLHWYWLLTLLKWLHEEYKLRYKKVHATENIANWMVHNPPEKLSTWVTWEYPPQCFGPHYDMCHISGDPVQAYRLYYITVKSSFAKWNHSKTPKWYKP